MWLLPGFSVLLAAKFGLSAVHMFLVCAGAPWSVFVYQRRAVRLCLTDLLCAPEQVWFLLDLPLGLCLPLSPSLPWQVSNLRVPRWARITRSVLLPVSWVHSWLLGHRPLPSPCVGLKGSQLQGSHSSRQPENLPHSWVWGASREFFPQGKLAGRDVGQLAKLSWI